jgi:hypothetical protein
MSLCAMSRVSVACRVSRYPRRVILAHHWRWGTIHTEIRYYLFCDLEIEILCEGNGISVVPQCVETRKNRSGPTASTWNTKTVKELDAVGIEPTTFHIYKMMRSENHTP